MALFIIISQLSTNMGNLLNKGKNVVELARGYNSFRELYNGCSYGRHAETDAMTKLETNPFGKLRRGVLKPIDLVVIQVNRHGSLANSKPCAKCISHLSKLKYHKIKHVYYSTSDGIIRVKFTTLLNETDKYLTRRFSS